MALLYDPGIFMPYSEADFHSTSWFRTWLDGPWHLHDTEPGGIVYLVNVATQRILWKTQVTRMVAVPYEGLEGLADEAEKRWGVELMSINMSPGGFTIGWMAQPLEWLDRGPRPLPDHLARTVDANESLDLDGWQFGTQLSPAFRYRWGLPEHDPSDEHFCTGKAPVGWFEA